MMDMHVEQFRPVPGFEQYYEIGESGTVKSLARRDSLGRNRKAKFLKPINHSSGYPSVYLHVNATCYFFCIHTLVLLAFVGPRQDGMEACHNDGSHTNNHFSNLRWDTHKANMQDKKRHGTFLCGEKIGSSKLTENDVMDIIKLRQQGVSRRHIAKMKGVQMCQVSLIARRKYWKHVHVS